MGKDSQESREAPQSLAPIQLERTGEDQDLANMRGRSGAKIAIGVLVVALAAVGGVRLLRSMDAHQAYATAAAQLERSETEQGDAFLRCALPNQGRAQIATPSALQGAIQSAIERMGKTYGKVLGRCTPLLAGFQQSVADIKAPPDVAPKLEGVNRTANDFGAAWTDLRDHLQHTAEVDVAQTTPLIEKIAATWQDYQSERTRAQEALSAKL